MSQEKWQWDSYPINSPPKKIGALWCTSHGLGWAAWSALTFIIITIITITIVIIIIILYLLLLHNHPRSVPYKDL